MFIFAVELFIHSNSNSFVNHLAYFLFMLSDIQSPYPESLPSCHGQACEVSAITKPCISAMSGNPGFYHLLQSSSYSWYYLESLRIIRFVKDIVIDKIISSEILLIICTQLFGFGPFVHFSHFSSPPTFFKFSCFIHLVHFLCPHHKYPSSSPFCSI